MRPGPWGYAAATKKGLRFFPNCAGNKWPLRGSRVATGSVDYECRVSCFSQIGVHSWLAGFLPRINPNGRSRACIIWDIGIDFDSDTDGDGDADGLSNNCNDNKLSMRARKGPKGLVPAFH